MKIEQLLKTNIDSLSLEELIKLENSLSSSLMRFRNGLIDSDSISPDEVEALLVNKLHAVSNKITAKRLRD